MPPDRGNPLSLPAPGPTARPQARLYLLTLWRNGEGRPCRAALWPAGATPRLGFADLDQPASYLLRRAEAGGYQRGRGPPHSHHCVH